MDEGFAIFPVTSMRRMATKSSLDKQDIDLLEDETLLQLSEDLVYRLRQIIGSSVHLMKFSCRKKLTLADVTETMESCDIDVSHGLAKEEEGNDPSLDLLTESSKVLAGENNIDVKRTTCSLTRMPPVILASKSCQKNPQKDKQESTSNE